MPNKYTCLVTIYFKRLVLVSLLTEVLVTERCMTFADCRLQITDCKLNDTKNLPNKGDVLKNITSCESEKVTWGQG